MPANDPKWTFVKLDFEMFKSISIIIISFLLSGCTYSTRLALFNNSNSTIEICALRLSPPQCESIGPKSLEKLRLLGAEASSAWNYFINNGDNIKYYKSTFGQYSEQASNLYCEGDDKDRCYIPIQYEESGLLFWAGIENKMPVDNFPNQPKDFPSTPKKQYE